MDKVTTKKTRHAFEIYAVFFNDKKIGHIAKESKRDGFHYTSSRDLSGEYMVISGSNGAFSFDEAVARLVDKHRQVASAVMSFEDYWAQV